MKYYKHYKKCKKCKRSYGYDKIEEGRHGGYCPLCTHERKVNFNIIGSEGPMGKMYKRYIEKGGKNENKKEM